MTGDGLGRLGNMAGCSLQAVERLIGIGGVLVVPNIAHRGDALIMGIIPSPSNRASDELGRLRNTAKARAMVDGGDGSR